MYCFLIFYFSTVACAVTVLNFVDKGTQTSSTALESIVAHSNRGTHTRAFLDQKTTLKPVENISSCGNVRTDEPAHCETRPSGV